MLLLKAGIPSGVPKSQVLTATSLSDCSAAVVLDQAGASLRPPGRPLNENAIVAVRR